MKRIFPAVVFTVVLSNGIISYAQPRPLPHQAETPVSLTKPNPLREHSASHSPSVVRLASGEDLASGEELSSQPLHIQDVPSPITTEDFLGNAGFDSPQPTVASTASAPKRLQNAQPSATTETAQTGFPDVGLVPPSGGESLFASSPFADENTSPKALPLQRSEQATPSPGSFDAVGAFDTPQAKHSSQVSPIIPTPAVQPLAVPSYQSKPATESGSRLIEPAQTADNQRAAASSGMMRGSNERTASASSSERNVEGTGIPGPRKLHGAQAPQLVIEKVYPEEIQVDQAVTLKTIIRNNGTTTAEEVFLADQVPQGTRLVSTNPQAGLMQNSDIAWELGTIEPGQEAVVEMKVVPLREGEIGSVARVMFGSSATARTVATKPALRVDVKAPQETMIGSTVNLEIVLSNPGTGTATGITLEEFVPEGLYHKDGKQLANRIGQLKPKESMKLTLPLQCVGAGNITNRLVVRADGNLTVEERTVIRVLAPALKLEIGGMKQRFLDRQATYQLSVANPGTAAATNVDLVCRLPSSMQFVSTNQSGLYEASTHTVHWALEELPANEAGQIELVTMPVKSGDYQLKFAGTGQNGLKSETSHAVTIDGHAAVAFTVKCLSDLVEVGKDTVYEISVVNRGTKTSTNVVVAVQLSRGMNFISGEGPVKYRAADGVVQFHPLARLEPKQERVYRVTARCLDDGDHRISVKMVSDDLQAPVTKEESTRVIASN